LKHPHNPFWITASQNQFLEKKAAQHVRPPSATASKKTTHEISHFFSKTPLCKNSIKPKILCIIYKSVIFMLEKTIKNQELN